MNMRFIWRLFPKTTKYMVQEIDELRFKNAQLAHANDILRGALLKILHVANYDAPNVMDVRSISKEALKRCTSKLDERKP